jgi:hypothetical protein
LLGALACITLLSAPANAAASGPRNLEQPYLETSGHAEAGETLSCYPGAWEGSGVTYAYEWQRDGVALSSGPTHQIAAADEGHWLSCVVSATDSEGTTTDSSVDSFFINPPREGPPHGGTIEGHVTDAANSHPIGGVKACAVNTDEAEPWDCVHTNASGLYKMTVAEAGHFVVEFTVPPHSPYVALTFYGGKYSKSEASVLAIASGSVTTGVDLQLQEGGQILGKVTSASSKQPVEGVEVCARESPAPCTLTDSTGEYKISGLATGEYTVQFSFSGSAGEHYFAPEYYDNLYFLNSISEANRVSVLAGHTVNGIDDELREYARLSGRVTSASTKEPIAGIEVRAAGSENGMSSGGRAITDANGEYTVTGMHDPRGEYSVEFGLQLGSELNYFPQWYEQKESSTQANIVAVPLGGNVSAIDAALEEGGQIAGVVTNAQTKGVLAGISACASNTSSWETRCATTAADGNYDIPRLPTGSYIVQFYSNLDNYYSMNYTGPVAVTLGNTAAGIDVAMEPVVKGTIMGSVDEAFWAKPIPNIEVCAYDLEQEELFGECTTSNSAGWYELRGLSAGKYVVEFSSPGPQLEYATQYYDKKPSPLYAEPVTVTEDKYTPGIEGSLEKAGDASGEVTSAESGKPLKGIDVCYYDFAEYLVGCELTNEKGEYETPPLASGEYRVLFVSPSESGLNYATQFYGGFASRFDSPYIDIKAGDLTTDIDAQMTSGGSITGDATDARGGKGIEGALVCALAPGFGEVGACAWTHAGGRYAIQGLDSGKYPVIFEANGYKWQYYDDVELNSQAQPVVVSVGAISEGIDAALQPTADQPPSNLVPPTISGTGAVGELLKCSSGTWTGNPTPTYTYAWVKAGRDVGSGNTYRVMPQDAGATLQCDVTAQNPAGVVVAYSDIIEVGGSEESPRGVTPPILPAAPVQSALPPTSIGSPSTTGSPRTPTASSPTTPNPNVDTTNQATLAASISSSSAAYAYSGVGGGTFVDSGELVHCPAGTSPCQIDLKVTAKTSARKQLVVSTRLSVPAGQVEWLKFKLDATGTALLHSLRRIHATIVSTMRRHGTKPITISRTVVLRSPQSHGN